MVDEQAKTMARSDAAARPVLHRPRILIDALAYHPGDGGFTTSLRHVLDTCARLGEFEFVVAHHRQFSRELTRDHLTLHPVWFPPRLRFVISFLLLPWIVRRTRADAVYCDVTALPAGLGVPGLVTVHDLHFLWDPLAGGRWLQRRLFGWVYWQHLFVGSLRRARRIRAISQTTADDIHRLVPGAAPVIIVQQYVIPPSPPAPPRTWPAAGEPVRLLFLGSVVPRRNLGYLLEALRGFRGEWRLDVVGGQWWGMAELGDMAHDPRVTFHGFVNDAERDTFLRTSHILVAPSVYEGFGAPIAEAMSHGMLVLASDIPAFREFVPDECRFALDDPGHLARLYNSLDAARYGEWVSRCAPCASRFSPEAHADGHRRLFTELLSATPALAEPAANADRLMAFRARVRRWLTERFGKGAEIAAHRAYHRLCRLLGRFDPPEDEANLRLLARFAGCARTIIDVGANYGLYGRYFARHAPADAVLHTFEPNADVGALLRSNVPASKRVRHFDVALGAEERAATLRVPVDAAGNPAAALGWISDEQPGGGGTTDAPVSVRTLDALVARGEVVARGPVFMKIDVEGSEHAVLRGASKLLGDVHPVIYFECEPRHLDRLGVDGCSVWNLLNSAGYEIFGCRSGRYLSCRAPREDVSNYFAIPGAGAPAQERELGPDELVARADGWARGAC